MPERTDHNEAMRLAEMLKEGSRQFNDDATALLLKLANRVAELESRVHTCGPTCSKAGCINRRLTAERDRLRAEVERLRARERACATVNEAEIIALVRMGQELAESMGLNPLTASPADIVNAARTHKDEK